jgi:hypothetical protein
MSFANLLPMPTKYKKKVSEFIKQTGKFQRKEQLSIMPSPDRVLIRISKKQMDDLISKEITKDDGTKVRLFFESIHFDEGYERRFQQNVSIGRVIGVGTNVHDVQVGDTVILDYLATNLIDDCIGFFEKDLLISILAHTTYHQDSSVLINGRRAWAKGDFNNISRILGIVRGDKLIPFDPYVFIEYKSDLLKILGHQGESIRDSTLVIKRQIIAAPEDSMFKCGQEIFCKKDDWFDREIGGKKIAVVFKQDILCKK